jgi:serine/threonine protein kinase
VEEKGVCLDILNQLPEYEALHDLEAKLIADGAITFERIFHEPCGYYNFRNFLLADYAADRAVFIHDVEKYKQMRFESARQKVAKLLFDRFVAPDQGDSSIQYTSGESTFQLMSRPDEPHVRIQAQMAQVNLDDDVHHSLSMGQPNNCIGVYGGLVAEVRDRVMRGEAPRDLFDRVAQTVLDDLKLDAFPRFCKSEFYRRYIRCKFVETVKVSVRDFTSFRVLGRGGFGAVHACRKNNSGAIYAMKCVNKKLVKVKSALDNILEERTVLTMMHGSFVTTLKYALQDDDNLYFIMDLMLGGDLKFHLINAGKFTEKRARFYAAQVLLGLEHVHSKNVIYRDMKLENVLLDHLGHCRLSDLGLAVVTTVKIRGYAGTPGYTSPEMIKSKFYGTATDIFSYGVMLYRMLCGSKPFKGKTEADLDRAVIEKKPVFPADVFSKDAIHILTGMLQKKPELRLGCGDRGMQEIKVQRFFQAIDWGLLEAGYVEPPFVPNKFDVNAASLKDIGDFDKAKFRHVKLDDKFKERVRDFGFISLTGLQEELVKVMEKADESIVFEKFSRQNKGKKKGGNIKSSNGCCTVM